MYFIFCSFPDMSDNCLALFQRMIYLNVKGNYIWLVQKNYSKKACEYLYAMQKDGVTIKIIKKNSFKGLFYYYKANFIFTTHGMFEGLPLRKKQIKINLWHGMPIKNIGNLDNYNSVNLVTHYTISNGKAFDDSISKIFNITENNIIKVGSPRNDVLFEDSDFTFKKIFDNDCETILWMPTYRQSRVGDIRTDGQFDSKKIGLFTFNEIIQINHFLKKENINICIKLHPMDILNDYEDLFEFSNSLSNIKILSADDRNLNHTNLYRALPKSVALLTDFSSIYFDYLLLLKPIGFIQPDSKKYRDSRGFIEEVFNKLEGVNIKCKEDLLFFIKQIKLDEFDEINKKKLQIASQQFQTYDLKGKNSESLLSYLGLIE